MAPVRHPSFLVLNGGVLQTSGSFTRDINVSNVGGPRMEWRANGGGFSAIGSQLTVDIGAKNGNAGLELPWSATLGPESWVRLSSAPYPQRQDAVYRPS